MSVYPLFCVQWLLTTVINDLSFWLVVLFRSPGSIQMRFLRKNCGDFRIFNVKIADQNWGNLTLEMARRDTERHGEDTERTLSAWRRFAGRGSRLGFYFWWSFFSFRFDLFVSRDFPSFLSFFLFYDHFRWLFQLFRTLCVSIQRNPSATAALSVAIQASFNVKIVGPKHEVCMDEFICPESVQRNGGEIWPWSLSALGFRVRVREIKMKRLKEWS